MWSIHIYLFYSKYYYGSKCILFVPKIYLCSPATCVKGIYFPSHQISLSAFLSIIFPATVDTLILESSIKPTSRIKIPKGKSCASLMVHVPRLITSLSRPRLLYFSSLLLSWSLAMLMSACCHSPGCSGKCK